MDEPPAPPVALASAAADSKLRLASALSREEVLRRRRRRLIQLQSLYRSQFWALADELNAKHAEYWWHHGASPVVVQPAPPALSLAENGGRVTADGTAALYPANCGPTTRPGTCGGGAAATPVAAAGGRAACSAANCGAKAIPLAPYCFDHILLDPKQQLYKPCTFVTRQSSMPNGKGICGKPALRGITPSRCSDHDPKKNIVEALKNVGINLPMTTGDGDDVYMWCQGAPLHQKGKNIEPENLLDGILHIYSALRTRMLCNFEQLTAFKLPSLILGRKEINVGLAELNSHKRNI